MEKQKKKTGQTKEFYIIEDKVNTVDSNLNTVESLGACGSKFVTVVSRGRMEKIHLNVNGPQSVMTVNLFHLLCLRYY
jgi:hypothetical protein